MTTHKLIKGALALIVFGGGVFLLSRESRKWGEGEAHASAPAFVMPVPVSQVVKMTVPVTLDYSARTESLQNVTLQSRVSGYLMEQVAADGADVKAGDLLYRIDPRDYQAALDQAKAQAQRESAALKYARGNLDRGGKLAQTGFLAKDSFDQRRSAMEQAEAALASDQASIRAAQLNLEYTEIRAPFSGRLGRNQAAIGTMVGVGGTVLNTLVQLDPIYVTFNPSETDLAAIDAARKAGPVKADIFLTGQTQARQQGRLSFLNNIVDQATGTITARALIDNHDFTLLPGQYVRIRLHLRDDPGALMVPQAALGSSQLGKYLYLVGKDNIVEQRMVSLGATHEGMVAITTGVAEGERIIDGNLQKIGPGMPVNPHPHS
ncbi:efflux transporter periplasmic adaptor subunit [Rhodoblastus sphagnicola]|uniref:Efflux transporter periplasmic adaptor subunit n=1 Tax=Rhodoblastus sphagnicola TaxID=333368 RepID=A0A2S6MWD2_9HYPH|nr:efflux RND transporter periplasmic adaptor subunit [Rhodoblastus sphagnicola]MBB4201124.1 multidrug efflux system membrane fusion protein [Rhodoblastus sphagnicola]PPQ26669.1 efflux transporter periplasmic adaptor subunit [Rhodoblastus sphagnicola]